MTTSCNHTHRSTARRLALLVLPLALVALTGCPPRGPRMADRPPPPPADPLAVQVARVNANVASITQTLAASGSDNVRTQIHDEGELKRYTLSGQLRFLPPRYFYLNFSHVGEAAAMRLGSNQEIFWVWVKPKQPRLWWGRWDDLDPAETYRMPLPPDMILAALGLAPLPTPEMGLQGPSAQIDGNDYYKLLYQAPGQTGWWIQREYWLDRYPPFLPRVVIFRDPDGQIQMRATLDDYRPLPATQVHVARQVHIEWPKTADELRVKWESLGVKPDITAGSTAFKLEAKRAPVPPDRWIRVNSEGEVPEHAAARPPATRPADLPDAGAPAAP